MQRLRAVGGHPNLLLSLHATTSSTTTWSALELCPNGELFDKIADHGALSVPTCIRYMRQLTSAIAFCHSHSIAHLDLSLENLLLDANNDIKLCDFGVATQLRPRKKGNNNNQFQEANEVKVGAISSLTIEMEKLVGRPGKPGYICPEAFAGQEFDGRQADMFSLGVILFMMLTGIPPWQTPTTKGTTHTRKEIPLRTPTNLTDGLPP